MQCQRLQLLQVIDREQPAIGHDDKPPNVRIAIEYPGQRGFERWRLGRVASEDLVIDRQALGRLHDPEQELAGDAAFLGHPEAAKIAGLLGLALGPDRGQVVEHDRELCIDHRTQQPGDVLVDGLLMVHQRIHAAQQLLMGQRPGADAGQADRLEPPQHAQLGLGVAQPVEDHHAQGVLDRSLEAGAPKDTGQRIKAELAPELIQRPDVAQ